MSYQTQAMKFPEVVKLNRVSIYKIRIHFYIQVAVCVCVCECAKKPFREMATEKWGRKTFENIDKKILQFTGYKSYAGIVLYYIYTHKTCTCSYIHTDKKKSGQTKIKWRCLVFPTSWSVFLSHDDRWNSSTRNTMCHK